MNAPLWLRAPSRLVRGAVVAAVLACAVTPLAACGDTQDAKHAKLAPGPMPENETWNGVYFHPVYGHLHMVEEGSNIVARWKRADGSRWGELSGVVNGNLFHYTWKEHTIGMVGAAATVHGKGYFVYKMDKENRPIIEGQFGLNDDETGSDWTSVKQARMNPDLKSIGGDSEGVQPNSF
jgi:hypothetical protein